MITITIAKVTTTTDRRRNRDSYHEINLMNGYGTVKITLK